MRSGPVAVIDIGSNSIKVLVAKRGDNGDVLPMRSHTIDARISNGISKEAPRLSEDGMARGLEAIRVLLTAIAEFSPEGILLVATSAVRDAENRTAFCERVRTSTGHSVQILTGDEEANLIGRGLTCDPLLRDLQDFYVFDLGGGSLECLTFRERRIEQAVSLQLGCVRLTERFVEDTTQPLTQKTLRSVAAHSEEVLSNSPFRFSLPADAVTIGTGGTVTTIRALFSAREGKSFDAYPPQIPVIDLIPLLDTLAEIPLAERKLVSGLPAARADVFPVALVTLITVARIGGLSAYHNSLYNLRYGVAANWLQSS